MTNPPPGSVPPAGQPPGSGGTPEPAPEYQQPGYAQPGYGQPGYPPAGYPPPGGAAEQPPAQSQGPAESSAAPTGRAQVRRTRISALWIGLIVGALFLLLLIVFIAQNSLKVPVHFLGFSGHLSLGLALLVAAVFGLLIAAIPGTIRIVQLRTLVHRGGSAPSER
jgi:uncharacterized integral membrane protein